MKFINDPDKIVEKAKKKRAGLYQSSQHPGHFENEGSEFQEAPGMENGIMATTEEDEKEEKKKKEPKKPKELPEHKSKLLTEGTQNSGSYNPPGEMPT